MQKNNTETKVALITGAGRRIGAELANAMHAAGFNIIVHYHTSYEHAHKLCEQLNQKRADSAIAVQADLVSVAEIRKLVMQAQNAFGRLDVLINNASRFYRTPMGDVSEAAWDDLLNTNLRAPFFLAEVAAPFLAKQRGCIVNIADIHGERPMRDYSAYCISKAGLLMLTKVLAKELGPHIRVNAVSPSGGIIWPEGENEVSEAAKEKIKQRIILNRLGAPDDIANAVLYFVTAADFVTGQVLAVDGGRSLLI